MRTVRSRTTRRPAVYYAKTELARELSDLTEPQQRILFDLTVRGAIGCGVELFAAIVTPRGLYLLVRIPKPGRPSLSETLHRLKFFYSPELADKTRLLTANTHSRKNWKLRPEVARCHRMQADLSNYLRHIKQNFSFRLHSQSSRRGRVWKDRFTAFLVEDKPSILSSWVAFIAGLRTTEKAKKPPETHPFSTFRLAVEGKTLFRDRIRRCTGRRRWERALSIIREKIASTQVVAEAKIDRGHIDDSDIQRAQRKFAQPSDFRAIHDGRWQEFFARLKRYHGKHGHTQFDWAWNEDPELRRWAIRQRSLGKMGRLNSRRLEALKSIPFDWRGTVEARPRGHRSSGIASRSIWEKRCEEFEAFHREFGHARVPSRYASNPTLGNWVWRQRMERKNGKLTDDMIRRLDAVGIDWDPNATRKTARSNRNF